jgi:uncharacterized protein YutE (UPF0331/DUF86 family)
MIDKELINSKLSDIQNDLSELLPLLNIETEEIIADNLKLHTVERLFQLIVDAAIDVNTHIIQESDFKTPADYQSTFLILGESKVLPMDFALKIAPSVGLRNLIVHKYGRVDLKRMIDDIKNEIGDYLKYLKLVEKFLEK